MSVRVNKEIEGILRSVKSGPAVPGPSSVLNPNRRSGRPSYGENLTKRHAQGGPCGKHGNLTRQKLHKGPSHPQGDHQMFLKGMEDRTIGKMYPAKRAGFASQGK